jgi:hypothetical protein
MKQQPFARRQLGVLVAVIAIVSLFLIAGCDSPNSPEMPPYKQIAQYNTPAMANDVAVDGHMIAIAAGSYGSIVLDASDLGNIREVFVDPPDSFNSNGAGQVAIDATNHIIITGASMYPSSGGAIGAYLNDYVRPYPDTVRYMLNFQGKTLEMKMSGSQNRFMLYESSQSTNRVFYGKLYTRTSDTASIWNESLPVEYLGGASRFGNYVQGFDVRSDGIIAMAVMNAGLHFHSTENVDYGELSVPSIAYDCAWAGNNLVVASNALIVMVNVDDVTHPRVVSTLFIPSANTLRKVAVDGQYAMVMDDLDGVYVVDISDPSNMKYVQLLGMSRPTSVCSNGGKVYVTNEVTGLVIFSR